MPKDKKEKKKKQKKAEKEVEVEAGDESAPVVELPAQPAQPEEQEEQAAAPGSSDKENEAAAKEGNDDEDGDLMEVDVNAEAPLSRKQRRLKKKEEMLAKSHAKEKKEEEKPGKAKRSEHGVWIGNLSYATDKKMLQAFFSSCGKPTRIHLPCSRPGVNRGFAYVDFATADEVASAIALSETMLDGRKVLIKDAHDFVKNTPTSEAATASKPNARPRGNQRQRQSNPPAATLFVGNLPFSTVKSDLEQLFSAFGRLHKVRLMTFEDSGKCKGFAYVDYVDVEGAKAAVESPKNHYLEGRVLRVEYGSEEAVKRGAPWIHDPKGLTKRPVAADDEQDGAAPAVSVDEPERQSRRKRRRHDEASGPQVPSAPARGPMSAVPFEGKKITFDNDDDDD